MKILLTGATGYIGKRILPMLIAKGYTVVCCVRDKNRYEAPESLLPLIEVIESDLLNVKSLELFPQDIDAALYLVHSMSSGQDYESLESASAVNFKQAIEKTNCKQVIYLSGIVNEEELSRHLSSRKNVENTLSSSKYALTTLRAGIIIGSGSASFEIIRDLVEKLPIMVTPKWLNTKCQPVAISNVIEALVSSLFNEKTYNQNFDIGGPDILSYKEMLLQFAEVRMLKRFIFTLPIMTPRLSSYWLYFVTSTSYRLAVALVDSMKINVVCRDNRIHEILGITPIGYKEALRKSFARIEQNEVVSSWKDSQISGVLNIRISDFLNVPSHGCFIDKRQLEFKDRDKCIDKIWNIGGKRGWYYATWLWKLRGFADKLWGGVGLRRGRTSTTILNAGDAIDFWRVLLADKANGRLLLFAEMKLPGEAWLEFRVDGLHLVQTATFRPRGLAGRIYWFMMYPFHGFIFKGMLKKLVK